MKPSAVKLFPSAYETTAVRIDMLTPAAATEGPAAVGRRVHQVIKGPGGLSVPAHVEVTGYEPMTRYAFRGIAGPVRPVGEFLFSGQGERTTVSFSLSVELTGIKKLLMSRAVQRAMDGEVRAIEQARQSSSVLEGRPPRLPPAPEYDDEWRPPSVPRQSH